MTKRLLMLQCECSKKMWLVGLAIMAMAYATPAEAYFADWSALTRDREPQCVNIPSNLSLCHNIGYTKMRLPNLLDHDTLHEVSNQAGSWVPLLNINCHPDTQLFLCSLFAPVCLESPIYPCRSLCNKVKYGCANTMSSHGYPWPKMLDCDKFPVDNDMCITSQSERGDAGGGNGDISSGIGGQRHDSRHNAGPDDDSANDNSCSAEPCNQVSSYDNIIQNYCKSDFVLKLKFRRLSASSLHGKVNTVFKAYKGTPKEMRKLGKPKLLLREQDRCCSDWLRDRSREGQRYLVMGERQNNGKLMATFIVPWSRDRNMKRARRAFKHFDCSSQQQDGARANSEGGRRRQRQRGGRRRNRRRRHRHGEEAKQDHDKVWQF